MEQQLSGQPAAIQGPVLVSLLRELGPRVEALPEQAPQALLQKLRV